jgi:hypothetical protein
MMPTPERNTQNPVSKANGGDKMQKLRPLAPHCQNAIYSGRVPQVYVMQRKWF